MHNTNWEKSSKWYGSVVGQEGHYYHQHLVLPAVIKQLNLSKESKLIDLGCGQGVLARVIPKECDYLGIDASASLIRQAKKMDLNNRHRYMVGDATSELEINDTYSHAAIILALQNMKDPNQVIKNMAKSLLSNGIALIVLNHPCFRIPRQSGWDVDPANKIQKRWVNRYMTPMEIPITMHPSKEQSEVTWSYHFPLSYYIKALSDHGFVVDFIDELVSDKESVGKASKMENRSRNDIPLFLTIRAIKVS